MVVITVHVNEYYPSVLNFDKLLVYGRLCENDIIAMQILHNLQGQMLASIACTIL